MEITMTPTSAPTCSWNEPRIVPPTAAGYGTGLSAGSAAFAPVPAVAIPLTHNRDRMVRFAVKQASPPREVHR